MLELIEFSLNYRPSGVKFYQFISKVEYRNELILGYLKKTKKNNLFEWRKNGSLGILYFFWWIEQGN